MKIKMNANCTRCGRCLSACPKMPDKKDYKIFDCSCTDKPCLSCCPRDAIFEINGIIAIDRVKCNNCGDCLKMCPKKAVIGQKGYFSKCDLCFETGKQKCISACGNGALSLEYDDSEKERLREVIGWSRINYDIEKKLEENDGFQVIKAIGKEEPIFSLKLREISYDEALIMSRAFKELRECGEYDVKAIGEILESCCAKDSISLQPDERSFLCDQIRKEMLGYSVLDDLIDKNCLEEIAVLGENKPIYVYHKKFGWLETDVRIENSRKIVNLINRMSRSLGRRVTMQKPKLNADIALGRVHAAISPISSGPCLTIRKFNKEPFTPYDLARNKTISSEALAFLWLAVQCDFNILICGNTGSGKTSTLNTLFSFVPKSERIILIEETPEIVLPHSHLVKLVVNEDLKIGFDELITDTLRMRPDRIIVGEVRSASDSKALMNTMLAGQGKGSFSTFHAQSGREALTRLQTLGIMPIDLCAIDLVIVQRRWTRYRKGAEDVRRVIEISGIDKNEPKTVALFDYDQKKDRLSRKRFYDTDVFRKICFNFGFGKKEFESEIRRRKKIIERKPESFADFFRTANEAMVDG